MKWQNHTMSQGRTYFTKIFPDENMFKLILAITE